MKLLCIELVLPDQFPDQRLREQVHARIVIVAAAVCEAGPMGAIATALVAQLQYRIRAVEREPPVPI